MKKIIRITTIPASLRGLLNGQLSFMSNYFEMIGISSSLGGLLYEVGKEEGVRTITVEMTRKITPVRDLLGVYKLYKIFKKEKPDIVHTHTPKAGTLGMVAAKLAGVPNRLHTIAGLPLLEATGIKRMVLNAVEKLTYRCATKIYPNSFGLYHIILEQKFTNKNKLKVLGNGSSNGIDTTYFDTIHFDENYKNNLRKNLNITNEDFVFAFVGRLVKDKGINELINAFNKLDKKFKHIKLLLIGQYENHLDPLLPETMEVIKSNPNIIFTGWVDDVRPYLAISNVLTFPSYREGFPNVVMQASAMKLPCIVTNINGCNEIISQPENGYIIPVKDTQALYIAMEQVYALTKKSHNKMGETSRKMIVSKFEQQFVWNALLEEYQSLLNQKKNNTN
ncbi:glycosyltransferase involved in cell wall biosynthesis [Mariniflexile fucanivorans]|uniref:Glycosyltransferase involved in cell wall biosynthesis n=1 Tax=Mariniflexile fucanivorans TaxID=264023 RepID=A0A4R1RGB9_9FLAO|nr:glycosyltransferase family 4 protein [Mariniflexile fucanivorans]TCL65023.1 glycosyltransferase involved in cell wall biosynthesis [Mariniflexile fucanivorans]